MERSSGKGKAISSISSGSTVSTYRRTVPASTASSPSSKLEQDYTRCHQDPISSRVLSTTRTKPPVTLTECERDTRNSKHAASVKTTEFEDVEACESTGVIVAAQCEDVGISEYGHAQVLGYSDREGVVGSQEHLVAKLGLTQAIEEE